MKPLLVYLGVILFFHCSEYLWSILVHKENGWRALLISRGYLIAQLVCLSEFWIESIYFPEWKNAWHPVSWMGLTGVIIGQALRLYALVHARTAFTHQVRTTHVNDHLLVTDGPYAMARHPGYLGWYLWSISTQLLLINPVSFVLFLIWGWRFLNNRIQFEEIFLERFFGDQYSRYRQRTASGIPFIR